jgi:hypothetical protein
VRTNPEKFHFVKREKAGEQRAHQPCPYPTEARSNPTLLELGSTASFFKLLLDVLGFGLGYTFLDVGRRAID